MKKNEPIRIAVAESSVIIRNGLIATLKYISHLKIQIMEIDGADDLKDFLRKHTPDILVINPMFGGFFDLCKMKGDPFLANIRYVALVCSFIDQSLLKNYDEQISLFDDMDSLSEKLSRLQQEEEESEDETQETLSVREKEIITCIAKEMTNKEIAESLCLSIHTVITHRRNIAKKLQIHSPAGLTIYAIANHLIEMKDLRMR